MEYQYPLPDDAPINNLESGFTPDRAKEYRDHFFANANDWQTTIIVLEWTFQIKEARPDITFQEAFYNAVIWYFG
jgi:hypothetical protein